MVTRATKYSTHHSLYGRLYSTSITNIRATPGNISRANDIRASSGNHLKATSDDKRPNNHCSAISSADYYQIWT
jgi:hypothetical protein